MNNQHVVRVMNQAGMVQRTNSGDLVGMYTLNQMAEVLALHDHVMAAERVAAVPLTNINAELQTAKEEIAYLKQQCEKSNQQGILAAKERDAAILQRDELRGECANSLRQNEAIASQFAYVNKAWFAACDEIGRVSANYRAAHNEMTRQLKRANGTETDAERLRADVARLTAELAKLGVFVA